MTHTISSDNKEMPDNVVLIHCHDMGDYLSCYDKRHISTPRIDRLSSDAMVFDQCFSSAPTCTPSRASMFTGLYPNTHRLMGLASGGHWELDRSVATIPSILSDVGYQCAHYGIWHIGDDLQDYGIDESSLEPQCDSCADNAIEFIERSSLVNKPFFLSVGFREPHLPWGAIDSDISVDAVPVPDFLPQTQNLRSEMAQFYSDVRRADNNVGRILDSLKENDLYDNTLVIFTSDHGIALPLAKGTLYDTGTKIPMMIRCPDGRGSGVRSTCLVSNVDILPTILDLVGVSSVKPSNLDGTSLVGLFAGEAQGVHDEIFCEQSWHDFYEPIRAIRDSRFKLIWNVRPGTGVQLAGDVLQTSAVDEMREELLSRERPEYELYDVNNDPREEENVYYDPRYRDVADRLRKRLFQQLEKSDDPILHGEVPCPTGYFEHFFMKKDATPGGMPIAHGEENFFTLRLPPPDAIGHRCTQYDPQ